MLWLRQAIKHIISPYEKHNFGIDRLPIETLSARRHHFAWNSPGKVARRRSKTRRQPFTVVQLALVRLRLADSEQRVSNSHCSLTRWLRWALIVERTHCKHPRHANCALRAFALQSHNRANFANFSMTLLMDRVALAPRSKQ